MTLHAAVRAREDSASGQVVAMWRHTISHAGCCRVLACEPHGRKPAESQGCMQPRSAVRIDDSTVWLSSGRAARWRGRSARFSREQLPGMSRKLKRCSERVLACELSRTFAYLSRMMCSLICLPEFTVPTRQLTCQRDLLSVDTCHDTQGSKLPMHHTLDHVYLPREWHTESMPSLAGSSPVNLLAAGVPQDDAAVPACAGQLGMGVVIAHSKDGGAVAFVGHVRHQLAIGCTTTGTSQLPVWRTGSVQLSGAERVLVAHGSACVAQHICPYACSHTAPVDLAHDA